MSISECHPGQRWISNTEPELGLGIAFEVADRRVTITFPASEERRIYALDNAPLTRVKYRIADRVRSEDGTEIIVAERTEVDGCIIYSGLNLVGEKAELHEIDLDSFVQFNRPLDRLFTGQIDKGSRFQLRARTLAFQHQHQVSPVYGLLGPRVQYLPHQFYIADNVSARHAPRVLLADEVGLGKTIEAGLILHRLMLVGRVTRALIVLPDNLVHQWLVEMLRRFNLRFSIIDGPIAEELELSEEGNPFESAQLVITPLSFLVSEPERLQQAVAAEWDLLIVDEAHHLAWSEDGASAEYSAVEALAAQVAGLLLLTATPEQLGVSGHFARLSLLDPHRYNDLASYLEEEQRYAAVSTLVSELIDADADTAPEQTLLNQVENYLGAARVAEIGSGPATEFSDRLVRELLDHHGTGRVLLRNCRDNIAGFPERELTTYPLALPEIYQQQLATQTIEEQLTPEPGFDDDWLTFDPRAEWLAGWIKAHRRDKILVICAHSETAQGLEAWLRLRRGIRSAVFHEDMDLVQRDRAAAYFADPEEDAEVMVCSEIGSEGRNFQFARHLVLLDLPLNPDLLEQRIGRLDRIGQVHTVEIHVPFFEHGASAVLLSWLHHGINAFERICPAGPALFAEFSDELSALMTNPEQSTALEDLIQRTAARSAEVLEVLQQGRDRLLELNSHDPVRAKTVIDAVESCARSDELKTYMASVFDEFGVEHEDNGAQSEVLHPGDHMSCEVFPGLPDGGLTVTFDRAEAQVRDDMHFLTWEHPMVMGAMDMVLGSEFGNTGFGIVKTASLTPGTILVECLFVVVCPAPQALRIERFLPQSTLRIVIDSAGEEMTDKCTAEWMDNALRTVPGATAQKVVQRMRESVEQLTDHATHLCEVRQETIITVARKAMDAEITGEIDRLRQLARVNPNIRAEEISVLENNREGFERYLASAQLKLDAVRVVVAT